MSESVFVELTIRVDAPGVLASLRPCLSLTPAVHVTPILVGDFLETFRFFGRHFTVNLLGSKGVYGRHKSTINFQDGWNAFGWKEVCKHV